MHSLFEGLLKLWLFLRLHSIYVAYLVPFYLIHTDDLIFRGRVFPVSLFSPTNSSSRSALVSSSFPSDGVCAVPCDSTVPVTASWVQGLQILSPFSTSCPGRSADKFYCYFFPHRSNYPSVSRIAPNGMNVYCIFSQRNSGNKIFQCALFIVLTFKSLSPYCRVYKCHPNKMNFDSIHF